MTLAAPASPPVAAGLSPLVPVLAAGMAMALIVMSQTVPDLARGPCARFRFKQLASSPSRSTGSARPTGWPCTGRASSICPSRG